MCHSVSTMISEMSFFFLMCLELLWEILDCHMFYVSVWSVCHITAFLVLTKKETSCGTRAFTVFRESCTKGKDTYLKSSFSVTAAVKS